MKNRFNFINIDIITSAITFILDSGNIKVKLMLCLHIINYN